MNDLIISNNEKLTMTSKELANLLGKRHDSVRRTIKTLSSNNVISFTHFVEPTAGGGKPTNILEVNERNSYIVVAQLSPEFTAILVDEWKKYKFKPVYQIPQTLGEALQLAADQAKQLELQAPKVAFVDNCVERGQLMTATQVAQKHKMSAVKLNRFLLEYGGVYNKAVKRSKVFLTAFVIDGYGEMKQTELGHSQCLFTTKGEQWVNGILITEGEI